MNKPNIAILRLVLLDHGLAYVHFNYEKTPLKLHGFMNMSYRKGRHLYKYHPAGKLMIPKFLKVYFSDYIKHLKQLKNIKDEVKGLVNMNVQTLNVNNIYNVNNIKEEIKFSETLKIL